MEPLVKTGPLAVSASQLKESLADLQSTSPWYGLTKTLSGFLILGALSWMSLTRESTGAFVAWSVVTGIFYSAFLLLTHDAMHGTLTGWKVFDEVAARLIAYPVIWYHGIYAALHDIHHKMNGSNPRDPERPQWTEDEYASASALRRWTMRNQIWLNCFVWGGFGFLYKHYYQAYKFYKTSRAVRLAIWTDVLGVFTTQGLINYWALSTGNWLRAFCFFIIIERIMGCVHQYRAWIEHYGLWGKQDNAFETQIRNSRNLKTNAFTSFFFDHLNYHSVHHAFPKIPFYHLKKAHERIKTLYAEAGNPLEEDDSYLKTGWRLATKPLVIATHSPVPPAGSQVIPMSQARPRS